MAAAAVPGSPRARGRAPPPPPPPHRAPPPPPHAVHAHHHHPHASAAHRLHPPLQPSSPRPLSISSIASSSSSSSSSGASSCSGGGRGAGGGGRGGGAGGSGCGGARGRLGAGAGGAESAASCAYLASIESLDDGSDDEDDAASANGAGGGGGGGGRTRAAAGGSHGSGDSGRCSPGRAGVALPYAQRVVAEVFDSERVYVRDLRQVVEGYLHCWRSQSDCPLSDQQLADLFSNIEEIYEFNSSFLEQLEECGLDPVQVARCFVRHNAGFCIYTQYCTNYPRTVSVLTELMRVEAAARLFRERQTALAHALPLGSFLLKPVQRILKYHLLLQNIVKHLEPDAEGRADVVDALSTMTGIAHHINSMKRRHEHAVRVQEIQSLLYGWEGEDLTTFGELCAEGAFRLAGAKALRHAFLFDRMLLITKKKEEGVLSYKAHILCSNLMLIESVPGEPLSFHVIPFDNPRLQYTLRARNLEQKREWALQLKRVILENYNAVIPSHARRLVMELGQNRTDDEILADKTPPRRQHSAPEYLEKRKQERERRKSETGLRHRLRRQRKSDTGLSAGEQSPSSPRRHRRASSSSRERSHSRDGLRSVSPAAIKERFGSWRRKSEPGCYSSSADSKSEASPQLALLPERSSSPAALQCGVETPSSDQAAPIPSEALQSPSSSPASSISASTREVPNSGSGGSCADGSEQPTAGQRSLEEIVGQLLLQNHEFQKMLKRQQRRQQMRTHHRSVPSATAETSDTETEADDGAYESLTLPLTLTPPPKMKTDQLFKDDEEQESDYVTLAAPHGGSASSSRRSGDYDNLQQIWESVRRQQEEIRRLAEREGVGERDCDDNEDLSLQADESIPTPSLRRAQSFCTSGTPSTPRSSTASTTNTAASLEALDSAPTAPAVWLRQQGAHLATPSKKSGSLPRSFQLAHGFGTAAAILAGTGRPFTIASDPPSEINFEDIERYMAQATANGNGARHAFPLAPTSPGNATGDTTEDESLPEATTPAASLRELNVHPEHKIYRPAAARAALRQVVVNVSARLTAGLRASSEALDDTSNDNQQNNSGNTSSDSRRMSRRIMSAFRHYSKTRLRLHSFVGEESPVVPGESTPSAAAIHRSPPPPTPPPPPPATVGGQQLPIYKQGSSRLGARIALCSSDYANPQQLLNHLPSRPPEARPDSVLSASSAFTSSSDGERPPQLLPEPMSDDLPTATTNGTREDPPLSDGSADSYYERSFEAIESLLENDVFRDSAVFSDHDDDPTEIPVPVTKTCPRKVPPPVPAKPDTLKCRFIHVAVPTQADVKEKSRVLAETAARSLAARTNGKLSGSESNGIPRGRLQRPTQLMNVENQRRHEEDWESGSQHSAASTVVEVVQTPQHLLSDDESNTMQQKGWVKHVIGKLQGPPSSDGPNCRKITSPTYSEVADSG